jgi:hypothetical protein
VLASRDQFSLLKRDAGKQVTVIGKLFFIEAELDDISAYVVREGRRARLYCQYGNGPTPVLYLVSWRR